MSTKNKPTTWRAAARTVAPDVPAPSKQVATWPLIDRFPVVHGQNLNHAYISAAMRSCTQGYRQQFVDVLDELLEREPFGYACLAQRILTTAGARKHVRAAEVAPDDPDAELAEKARALVEAQIRAIPNFTQHCATLLWAIYYGLTALEKMWERVDRPDASWWITDLHFIHSRRLAYPDMQAWRLHVWDQGAVNIADIGTHPTEGIYGLAVDDYPHKFIIHSPQLRGDYPTRDGLGRELAFWMSLKGMAARGAGQNVERFAKPWAWATYNTGTPETQGKPRVATDEDIKAGDAAVKALGIGALAGASLPDSIALHLTQPESTGAIGHKDFLAYCDEMIAACIRGNTNTAKMGRSGSRSALEVQNTDEMQVVRYDAVALGATLTEYIARDVIALNMPEALHLVPVIEVAVEEEPDPEHIATVLQKAVMSGIPADADAVGAMLKLPLIPNETKGPDGKPMPRRCVPLKPMDLGATSGVSDAQAEKGKTSEDGNEPPANEQDQTDAAESDPEE